MGTIIKSLFITLLISLFLFQLFSYIKLNKKHSLKKHTQFYKIPSSGFSRGFSILLPLFFIIPTIIAMLDGNSTLIDKIYYLVLCPYSIFFYITLDMNLILTNEGIGIKSNLTSFYTQFIPWNKVDNWSWNKFDKNLLCIAFTYKKMSNSIERKVKFNKAEINNLLLEYIPEKLKI